MQTSSLRPVLREKKGAGDCTPSLATSVYLLKGKISGWKCSRAYRTPDSELSSLNSRQPFAVASAFRTFNYHSLHAFGRNCSPFEMSIKQAREVNGRKTPILILTRSSIHRRGRLNARTKDRRRARSVPRAQANRSLHHLRSGARN